MIIVLSIFGTMAAIGGTLPLISNTNCKACSWALVLWIWALSAGFFLSAAYIAGYWHLP